MQYKITNKEGKDKFKETQKEGNGMKEGRKSWKDDKTGDGIPLSEKFEVTKKNHNFFLPIIHTIFQSCNFTAKKCRIYQREVERMKIKIEANGKRRSSSNDEQEERRSNKLSQVERNIIHVLHRSRFTES